MKLGPFSLSLNVEDLNISRQFYETLRFKLFAGEMEKNYSLKKNVNALLGIFDGMFEGNIITFNPGWDENAEKTESFVDVREIQRALRRRYRLAKRGR